MLNKKDAQRRKERAGGSPVSGMAQFRGSHCYLIMSWGREPTTVDRRLEGSKRNHGLSRERKQSRALESKPQVTIEPTSHFTLS